jgi:hypothetical protein
MSSSIFITLMAVLLVFNFFYVSLMGNAAQFLANMAIGGILTVIVAGVLAALLTSINVLGSGLSTAGTKIIFGFSVLLGLLFQITFTFGAYQVPLGVGLLQNVFMTFNPTDGYGIPFFLVMAIGVTILVTGIQTIQGGGGEA